MAQPDFAPVSILGAFRLNGAPLQDQRGSFAKIFASSRLPCRIAPWTEGYVTTSLPGVVRGMHFQLPPHHHDKLVVCLSGRVLDVLLDLRHASPTHLRSEGLELDGGRRDGVLVPAGCAHGFRVLGDEPATLLYLVTTEHAPAADAGVRWDSFGFAWPAGEPVLSARDRSLPALATFTSPF